MGKLINSLNILQYRSLSNVSFEEMNSINIFTGSNNSGKTSVLEAICLTRNPLRLSSWFNIAYNARLGGKSTYTELLRMFPIEGKKIISLSFNSESTMHSIKAEAEEMPSSIPRDELMRLNGYIATGAQKPENKEMISMKYLAIETCFDGEISRNGVYEQQQRIIDGIVRQQEENKAFFISQNERVGGYFDILQDLLTDNHYRNMLIEILRQFDKEVEGISMIENEVFVHSGNHRKAIPLGVYGSGIKKAIFILAVILQNRDGCVLIDEFETGMHEEVLKRIYGLIFETAREQKVQLFMTTHNTEAIKRLLELDKTVVDTINLYTLYEKDGNHLVRRLSGSGIIKAIELGVAIR